MKKFLLIVCLLIITLQVTAAPFEKFSIANSLIQKKKKKETAFDRTKLLLGPGLGFGAYNRGFSIYLAPTLAYCLTDNFHVGTTLSVDYFQQTVQSYNSYSNSYMDFKYKIPSYSFSIFARYILAQRFILHLEPQISRTKLVSEAYAVSPTKLVSDSKNLNITSMIAGVGYVQRFGEYSYSYLMICYDLKQNPNNATYYQTIVPKMGVMISLFNN